MSREWTPDRIEEFKLLNELITEARMIDNGTNALRRIQKCIAIAEDLDRTNHQLGRESFVEFMREKVFSEIKAQ